LIKGIGEILIPFLLDGGFMKPQRQVIPEEKVTWFQREDILYLSGIKMVDEKKLSLELLLSG
jgi:hypothetical protein